MGLNESGERLWRHADFIIAKYPSFDSLTPIILLCANIPYFIQNLRTSTQTQFILFVRFTIISFKLFSNSNFIPECRFMASHRRESTFDR